MFNNRSDNLHAVMSGRQKAKPVQYKLLVYIVYKIYKVPVIIDIAVAVQLLK